MTGEMSWIKPNGDDSNGEGWPVHAAVARALRCRLRPFDSYIGPYIDHKCGRLWLSTEDGMMGQAVLWPGGVPPAYCEPIVSEEFFPLQSIPAALRAARAVLKQCRLN